MGAPGQTIGGAGVPARGVGSVKPVSLLLGGHEGWSLTNLTWRSYGGETAVATGTGSAPEPGEAWGTAKPRPITLHATLGTCHGKPAYSTLSWDVDGFTRGQNEELGFHSVNLCNLAAVG